MSLVSHFRLIKKKVRDVKLLVTTKVAMMSMKLINTQKKKVNKSKFIKRITNHHIKSSTIINNKKQIKVKFKMKRMKNRIMIQLITVNQCLLRKVQLNVILKLRLKMIYHITKFLITLQVQLTSDLSFLLQLLSAN